MRLIALESATGAPSVCLWEDGAVLGQWQGPARAEPAVLTRAAMQVLTQAGVRIKDLDVVGFGRGPGAFTGVRLAVALAQGLGLGAGLALVPVSDLAALAWRAARQRGWSRVVACLDARQGEVYWGPFAIRSGGVVVPAGPEAVSSPHDLRPPDGPWALAGSGVPLITDWVGARDAELAPDAEAVAVLAAEAAARGEVVPPEQAAPCYLRDRVATPSPRRHNPNVT